MSNSRPTSKSPTVAVFFQHPGKHAYPLHTARYRQRFSELACAVEQQGARMRIVREQSSYLGKGSFKSSWAFTDDGLVPAGAVTANVIFDKGYFVDDRSIPVFNPPALSQLCTDKYLTAQTFPDESPRTQYVRSEADYPAAIARTSTHLKVVKPVDGLGGEGVYIGTAAELQHVDRRYPCLVQDFLDTAEGIPGLVDGHHDLRIAILNGEIAYSLIRIPPAGKLVANVSLGASIVAIEPRNLPASALAMVEHVEEKLSTFTNRFYSIDLAFVEGQPKILELNSRVGLGDSQWHPTLATTKQQLATVLVDIARCHN